MAEHEDTSAALRRLEAALNRIAAQVAKPRPVSVMQDSAQQEGTGSGSPDSAARHDIVTKLDDLISGLRSALGTERPS